MGLLGSADSAPPDPRALDTRSYEPVDKQQFLVVEEDTTFVAHKGLMEGSAHHQTSHPVVGQTAETLVSKGTADSGMGLPDGRLWASRIPAARPTGVPQDAAASRHCAPGRVHRSQKSPSPGLLDHTVAAAVGAGGGARAAGDVSWSIRDRLTSLVGLDDDVGWRPVVAKLKGYCQLLPVGAFVVSAGAAAAAATAAAAAGATGTETGARSTVGGGATRTMLLRSMR